MPIDKTINQPVSHRCVADVLPGQPGIFSGNPFVPVTLSTKIPKQFYVHLSPWTTWRHRAGFRLCFSLLWKKRNH